MTPSAAEMRGYERANKYPKSTKYGRQNPIAARWNSEEQLVLWREAWANAVNRHLELSGIEARVDHRSHDRGLDEQPTIHEGVTARTLEEKDGVSDRCKINRQIRQDNAFLRELKAQIKKLAQTVKNIVPALAEAMESLRGKLIIFTISRFAVRAANGVSQTALPFCVPIMSDTSESLARSKIRIQSRKRSLPKRKLRRFCRCESTKTCLPISRD